MNIRPFKIAIPQKELKDLQDRIKRTRWPDEIARGRVETRACRWSTPKNSLTIGVQNSIGVNRRKS
jgi:hypothetical protein